MSWSDAKYFKRNQMYLQMASIWATNSYARRAKVGAIIVKDGCIISDGYNGMPAGMSNECEYTDAQGYIHTKKEVLHAESNALMKLCKYGTAAAHNSILYITHSPCIDCAKLIIQAGISEVHFTTFYRQIDGLKLLLDAGIRCFAYIDNDDIDISNFILDNALLRYMCMNVVVNVNSDKTQLSPAATVALFNLDKSVEFLIDTTPVNLRTIAYGMLSEDITSEAIYEKIDISSTKYEDSIHFEI